MAELAFAVVSLTFQVFAGCLKGYQLLSEASDMPKDYEHVRVRLKTEQLRLLDWARVTQISEDDSTFKLGVAGRGAILEVLHQQEELLFRFARHDKHLAPMTGLNRSDAHQQTSHTNMNSSQIMLLNSTVGQLLNIIEGKRSSTSPAEGRSTDTKHDNLAALAQAKAFNIAVQEGTLSDLLARSREWDQEIEATTSVELDSNDFAFQGGIPRLGSVFEEPRTDAFYPRDAPTFVRKHVWVEWRQMPHPTQDAKMANRLAALVTMLHSSKNTELFRAARCLGYFNAKAPTAGNSGDENHGIDRWCGIVFEKPPGRSHSPRPISLLELLRNHLKNGSSSLIPSLTQRVSLALALAENIERLHAINWLHKGLRSYNVSFFTENFNSCRVDFGKPILSGFDYSRPTGNADWTEKVVRNPAHDIYRQPRAQADYDSADGQAAFKKSYDYYSLGIILLEIALWRPVDSILGVDFGTARLADTMTAHTRLSNDKLKDVRAYMGDSMHSVIQVCLEGLKAFGLDEASDETDPVVAVKLQRAFHSKVVEKLKMIRI
ncbi:hypothetical protein M426DRAFT_66080 [Hypoxylon sp. CI-4A]|nr:hypothetical protein M426DRAFT_66080 [Hypoxylon sp. CI-4A]